MGRGRKWEKTKAEGKYVANCLLCWNRVIGGQRLGLDLSTDSGRQGIKITNFLINDGEDSKLLSMTTESLYYVKDLSGLHPTMNICCIGF